MSVKHTATKRLVYCGAALALAFIASYLQLVKMPWGGSVTLCSMLIICLTGYWYGLRTGLITGFAYGILQFLQEPVMLTFFQVCCDYLLGFAALGLAGAFRHSKNGLVKGYLLAILSRGAFHTLGGYLYWMEYIPEDFPGSLIFIYPFIYNYSFILAEGILTLVIIHLPPMAKALNQLKQHATA